MVSFLANIAYGMIAPIIPLELDKISVSKSATAALFSIYSLTVIFASPSVPWLLKFVNAERLVRSALLFYGVVLVSFGFSLYLSTPVMIVCFTTAL